LPSREADLPGIPEVALIILKNLQNLRICYAPMQVVNNIRAVLYICLKFSVGVAARLRGSGWRFCVMEKALKHKYNVGETVYFTASNVARPAASGTYEVIRLLPTDGDDCQYRIKSSIEAFERVAKESQLDVS
jgi:hypothetical protein